MRILKSRFRELVLLAFIILIGAIVASISPNFLTWGNITNLLRASSVNGIMAMGMLVLIITGNIDVSVGSSIVVCGGLSMVLVASNLHDNGLLGVPLSFMAAAAIGGSIGLINGAFMAYVKIPSIVVTLGMMSILRGLILVVTKGQWITGLPDWYIFLSNINVLGIYLSVIVWIVIIICTSILLNRMNIGRQILAIGGNQSAAERAGIHSARKYIFAFTYFGVMVGIAGVFFVSQNGMLDPTSGAGYEMVLIAAVVIGGASISGGKGTVLGTVLGVILLALIDNALVLARIPVFWQKFVTGLLVLLAVVSSAVEKNRFKLKAESFGIHRNSRG